ncbi:signal transduction protein [Nitrosopumilus oxyclinae]|uniref:Signal transduction protein n=1 Tax=Nitrosopumilus oxyclinae TaxID=1959104 RepID=A0A7D5R2R0_9ARCH|nr:CBS domain-containing protein [Nitrosopumilus oxyclinae]QLH04418.1 signal transduction protein [Nitrosopumilus oxyclinae]
MSHENFNSSILIQDVMTRALITVNPSTTAFQVAKMMEQGGIGAILVQDNSNPVGIVTDRDFATKIAAKNLPFDTPVEKIMSSPLITINHNEPISAAAERMTSKKIRKLAVTENGKVVGIITSTDLVTQLAK